MARSFPEGFTWGTATAAHQVEGNNVNSDWWAWEHDPANGCAEPSGDACDQYHLYREDVAMLAALGFDNYRFSVEWARIEPDPGRFSKAALDHYRRVCAACLEVGIDPVVTFHHFTTPNWVVAEGGWEDPGTVERFARYCGTVAEHLGDLVARACTINEPNIVAFMGWGMGMFPPGKADLDLVRSVGRNFLDAHAAATGAIKAVHPDLPVGLTLSMAEYVAVPADDPQAIEQVAQATELMEDPFLDAVGGDDFFGVQTYSRSRFGPNGMLPGEEGVRMIPEMGYEDWPDALAATIRRAWDRTGGSTPLVVTENGRCGEDDDLRIEYVHRALEGVLDCIDDGIEVLGYTYWSLLDNFEWAFGYEPRFGLVAVDRDTQRRIPKPSAEWLGGVARANALASAPGRS